MCKWTALFIPVKSQCKKFLPLFAEDSSEPELQAINTDFTFELFICAAILLENREALLQCRDEAQLIQFTSRCVYVRTKGHATASPEQLFVSDCTDIKQMCLLCSLQRTLDLNNILEKAESHLYNYCKRCTRDYMSGHCSAHESRGEDFLYLLRSLLVLKWQKELLWSCKLSWWTPLGSNVIFIPEENRWVFFCLYSIWLFLAAFSKYTVRFFVVTVSDSF